MMSIFRVIHEIAAKNRKKKPQTMKGIFSPMKMLINMANIKIYRCRNNDFSVKNQLNVGINSYWPYAEMLEAKYTHFFISTFSKKLST